MSTVSVWKAYQPAPDIQRSERSAAGTMPAAAFQYCQAMRTASAYGWYVYPPKDISLLYDGRETFIFDDEQWSPLKSLNFEDAFRTHWKEQAPENLKDYDPPFISELFMPGAIQIWSGYFVATAPGWSLSVRPPVNYGSRSSLVAYEGIVETDAFKPCPLFINVQLLATDREIYIAKDRPLFQIQPLPREAYASQAHTLSIQDGLGARQADFDWQGVEKTLRKTEELDTRRPGSYGVESRKR